MSIGARYKCVCMRACVRVCVCVCACVRVCDGVHYKQGLHRVTVYTDTTSFSFTSR